MLSTHPSVAPSGGRPGMAMPHPVEKKYRGLHSVAIDNDLREVENMLSAGAYVDVRNARGRTPLMGACFFGHVDIVRVLLARGADVNARCNEGATALMYAALGEQAEIASMLLSAGANRDARATRPDVTALSCARAVGSTSVARIVERRDILGQLPREIALHILSFLDTHSMLALAQCCHLYHRLANDKIVWRRLCARRGWSRPEVDMLMSYGVNAHRFVYAERNTLNRNWRAGRSSVRVSHANAELFSLGQRDGLLYTGCSDRTLRTWRADNGEALGVTGAPASITSIAFWGGNHLLTGDHDGHVSLWNTEALDAPRDRKHAHGHIISSIASGTDFCATSSFDAVIKLWSMAPADISCKGTLVGHGGDVHALTIVDSTVYSGSFDKSVRVWDVRSLRHVATINGASNTILGLAVADNVIAAADRDCSLRFWDRRVFKQTFHTIRLESWARSLEIHNNRLAAGCQDGSVRLYDWSTKALLWSAPTHRQLVTGLCMDDDKMVTASRDGTLCVSDFSAPQEHLLEVFGKEWMSTNAPLMYQGDAL